MATNRLPKPERIAALPEPQPAAAAEAPAEAEKAAETTQVARVAEHRLAFPVAPPAKISADVLPLSHIRAALEEAGYRNHPQALEAALEKVELVPTLRCSRGVQSYRSEVIDCLRGRIKQRDERAAQ